LNLSALAVLTTIVVRRARGEVAIAIMAAAAWFLWRVAPIFISAWNPHVTVFALMALIVAAADVVGGTLWTLPLVAAFASLVGQSHVGLFPTAVALGVLSVVAVLVRGRRNSRRGEATPVFVVTAVVLIVVWLPSVVEQFTGNPGNISQLWTFFVKESHRGQRMSIAFSTWSSMLNGLLRPDFAIAVGARIRPNAIKWTEAAAIAQLIGLGAVCAIAARAQRRFEAGLAALLVLMSILALWSATRIEETIFDHEVFWMSAVGALNIAMLASLAGRPLLNRLNVSAARGLAAVAVPWVLFALCTGIGLAYLASAITDSANISSEAHTVSDVAAELRMYFAREQIVRPLIRIDQDAWPLAAGVILRLQKDGVPVAVEDDWIAMFTPRFAATGREPAELAIDGKAEHVRHLGTPGETVVVEHDPLLFVHRVNNR
jgi:hypothetical protein